MQLLRHNPALTPTGPRLTQAQERTLSTAELMVADALKGLPTAQAQTILERVLVPIFGASETERLGDAIARAGHMAGRA